VSVLCVTTHDGAKTLALSYDAIFEAAAAAASTAAGGSSSVPSSAAAAAATDADSWPFASTVNPTQRAAGTSAKRTSSLPLLFKTGKKIGDEYYAVTVRRGDVPLGTCAVHISAYCNSDCTTLELQLSDDEVKEALSVRVAALAGVVIVDGVTAVATAAAAGVASCTGGPPLHCSPRVLIGVRVDVCVRACAPMLAPAAQPEPHAAISGGREGSRRTPPVGAVRHDTRRCQSVGAELRRDL
jgi:hypothetical protein